MPTLQEWIDCKGLPVAKCNEYRQLRGQPLLEDNGTKAGSVYKNPRKSKEKQENPPLVLEGPGTEFAGLMSLLGINMSNDCGCKKYMFQMNEWGVEGCKQRYDEIVATIKEKSTSWGWGTQMLNWAKAGFAYLTNPEIRNRVNYKDPIPDLVTWAIELAEQKEKK